MSTTIRHRNLFTSTAIRAMLAGDPLCHQCGGTGRTESRKRREPCAACGGDGVPVSSVEAWRAIDFAMALDLGRGEWKATRRAR